MQSGKPLSIMQAINKFLLPNFFDHMRFYGKKIISYDPDYLFTIGFINPKASVLSWGMAFRCLVMCGVGTFVSQFRCPTKMDEYEFCFPIMVSSEGLIFASLVSFLLGMFTSTTFTRWWACREKLSTVMNHVMMIQIMLNSFCVNPQVATLVAKIKRLSHLTHAVLHKQADNKFDLSDLVKNELCTQAEAKRIGNAKENMPALVMSWNLEAMRQLALSKTVPSDALVTLRGCISGSNDAVGQLLMLLNTQMPYSYLHLLTMITKIHLGFICFYAGGIIAQGIIGYSWTRILFGYVIIIAHNVIYEGLLFIHTMLSNPCGDDIGDFPVDLFWTSVYNTCNKVLTVPVPESPEPEEQEDLDIGAHLDLNMNRTITVEIHGT